MATFTIIFGGIIFDYNGASAFTIMLDRKREKGRSEKSVFVTSHPNVQLYEIYFNAASLIEMATLIHISFHYLLLLLSPACSVFSHENEPLIFAYGKFWKFYRCDDDNSMLSSLPGVQHVITNRIALRLINK